MKGKKQQTFNSTDRENFKPNRGGKSGPGGRVGSGGRGGGTGGRGGGAGGRGGRIIPKYVTKFDDTIVDLFPSQNEKTYKN